MVQAGRQGLGLAAKGHAARFHLASLRECGMLDATRGKLVLGVGIPLGRRRLPLRPLVPVRVKRLGLGPRHAMVPGLGRLAAHRHVFRMDAAAARRRVLRGAGPRSTCIRMEPLRLRAERRLPGEKPVAVCQRRNRLRRCRRLPGGGPGNRPCRHPARGCGLQ